MLDEIPELPNGLANVTWVSSAFDLCDEQDVAIRWVEMGPIRHGRYRPRYRRIDLNPRLGLRQLVPGLAHEYAHHLHGDNCSATPAEQRAWETAADLVITREEYARAESIVGSHPHAIALELDLTGVLVCALRSTRVMMAMAGREEAGQPAP